MTEEKSVGISHRGNNSKLNIKGFDFDMFVENPSIVLIAKRGSGKSWVVRALLQFFKNIPAGIVIAPTDRMNAFYRNFFPDSYIYYDYKSEIIEKIMDRQKQMKKKQEKKKADGKKIDPRAFVIMDDCLGQKGTWVRDPPIQELLYNGRHYELMYILTMQFPLGIAPELRANFDYIFLLAEDYISNKKRIYDHYAGMFPSFEAFRQVFDQLTDDFGSMVIVNRGVRKTIFEKIFWYKAPNLEDVKVDIGCKQFRDYHKNNYNEKWNDDDEREINADDFMRKRVKGKNAIKVDKIATNKVKGGIFLRKKT